MFLFPPVALHLAVNAITFNVQRDFPHCFVSRASNILKMFYFSRKQICTGYTALSCCFQV